MTNYNDGKWHPWDGGECPVHPLTYVEVLMADGNQDEDIADMWKWDEDYGGTIVAFRVLEEHREPREYWVSHLTGIAYISYKEALDGGCHPEYLDHVREVLD